MIDSTTGFFTLFELALLSAGVDTVLASDGQYVLKYTVSNESKGICYISLVQYSLQDNSGVCPCLSF